MRSPARGFRTKGFPDTGKLLKVRPATMHIREDLVTMSTKEEGWEALSSAGWEGKRHTNVTLQVTEGGES